MAWAVLIGYQYIPRIFKKQKITRSVPKELAWMGFHLPLIFLLRTTGINFNIPAVHNNH